MIDELPQDRLDRIFRHLCRSDPRVVAAAAYGSRPAGLGDRYSDVEYWLFVDDAALPGWDAPTWMARAEPHSLLVRNEFGAWVGVYAGLVRVELHFWPASDLAVVGSWAARGAPVDQMVVVDRDGRLAAALAELPTLANVPSAPEEVAELCGRFANWWLLGRNVLARGEVERAHDALGHVRRHLLWLARHDEGATARWLTPSRLAEQDLPAPLLAALAAASARADADDLLRAYRSAWTSGVRLWRSLAASAGFAVPEYLFAEVEESAF